MDILDFALQMELDGKNFYEKHASETNDKELKKILLMLAEEEQKHYNFFKQMKEGKIDIATQTMNTKSDTLHQVKNIFVEMSQGKDKKSFGEDVQSIWMEALKIEEKAEKFYREKAEIEADDTKKKLIKMIADEERNHVHMIDSVLTYLKFPQSFADTAQFKNFQSLEGH